MDTGRRRGRGLGTHHHSFAESSPIQDRHLGGDALAEQAALFLAAQFLVGLDEAVAVGQHLVGNEFVVLHQGFGIYHGTDDLPDGVAVAIHTCRGNFKSTWMASGGYDPVAETVFTRMNVNAFFLEYDTDRAGGFEPLRFVPRGKTVVLGLISSKVPTLESKDALKRRIESAAKYVPLENLCLSPQCGFSSTHHGNKITVDDQKRKLALALEVAREVWGTN